MHFHKYFVRTCQIMSEQCLITRYIRHVVSTLQVIGFSLDSVSIFIAVLCVMSVLSQVSS